MIKIYDETLFFIQWRWRLLARLRASHRMPRRRTNRIKKKRWWLSESLLDKSCRSEWLVSLNQSNEINQFSIRIRARFIFLFDRSTKPRRRFFDRLLRSHLNKQENNFPIEVVFTRKNKIDRMQKRRREDSCCSSAFSASLVLLVRLTIDCRKDPLSNFIG